MAAFKILPGVTDAPETRRRVYIGNQQGVNPKAEYVKVGENQYQLWSGRFGKVGSSGSFVNRLISGDRAVEFDNLPEFSTTIGLDETDMSPEGLKNPVSLGDASRRLAAYATGLTRKEQAAIIKKIPGASMSRDKYNNPIVRFKGKRFYVNKPGATGADLTTFFATVATFLPFGRVARIVQRVAGGGRAAGVGAMMGAGAAQQVALDETGRALGADQKADLVRTAISAMGAGAGEFLGQVLSRALSNYKLGNEVRRLLGGNRAYVDKDGTLSPEAKQTMKAMGIDPEAIEADIAKQVLSAVRGNQPKTITEALPLEKEFGITLRPGQRVAGANPAVSRGEEITMAGDDAAAATIRGDSPFPPAASVEGQRRATVEALRGTQDDLSGVSNTADDITRGTDIVDDLAVALQLGRETAKQAEKAAWDKATPSMDGVQVLFDGVKMLKWYFQQGLQRENFTGSLTAKNTPETFETLKYISRQVGMINNRILKANATSASVGMRQIENMRRTINASLDKKGLSSTDMRGLTIVKKNFDEWVDDVFSTSLVKGDPKALDLIKHARGTTRAFHQRYTANRSIDAISREAMDPRTVVQNLGIMNARGFGPNAIKIVKHIKDNFGDDVGNATLDRLKAATFMRFHDDAIKTVERGGETVFRIQGNRVSQQINSVLRNNKKYMNELFSPAEISKLKRYASMMRRVDYHPPKDLANPSGSATFFFRALSKALGPTAGAGGMGIAGFSLPMIMGLKGVAADSATMTGTAVGLATGAFAGRMAARKIQAVLKNIRVGNDLSRRPLFDVPLTASGPAAVGADASSIPVTPGDVSSAQGTVQRNIDASGIFD